MNSEEIEQNFASAGWELDGSFGDHLIIGSNDGISILAHKEEWGTDTPRFEILDHEKMITYWVSEVVPTPQQAQELLEEHGRQPQEWDG